MRYRWKITKDTKRLQTTWHVEQFCVSSSLKAVYLSLPTGPFSRNLSMTTGRWEQHSDFYWTCCCLWGLLISFSSLDIRVCLWHTGGSQELSHRHKQRQRMRSHTQRSCCGVWFKGCVRELQLLLHTNRNCLCGAVYHLADSHPGRPKNEEVCGPLLCQLSSSCCALRSWRLDLREGRSLKDDSTDPRIFLESPVYMESEKRFPCLHLHHIV